MQFTEDQIEIRPGHEKRLWQSCDYWANGAYLFHERTYFPYSPFKPVTSEQWTDCNGTRAEIEALAKSHHGHAMEQFYAPEGADAWFLAFADSDAAIAFCRSEDFDRWSGKA